MVVKQTPELFHFTNLKLYPLNTTHLLDNSPFYVSPVPANHHSTFCFYEFDYSKYII